MDLLHMALDLVRAQIAQHNITAETLNHWLAHTHRTLLDLLVLEQLPRIALSPGIPGRWQCSIGRSTITCLECGQTYRQLILTHLRKYVLTVSEYRQRHSIPSSQPLAGRAVTARRRQVAHEVKPWVKATAARWPKRETE